MPIIKLYNAFDPLGDKIPLEIHAEDHLNWTSVLDEAQAAQIWPSLAHIPRRDLRFCRKSSAAETTYLSPGVFRRLAEGTSVYLERIDTLDELAKKRKRREEEAKVRKVRAVGFGSGRIAGKPLPTSTPTRSSTRNPLDSGLGSENSDAVQSPVASTSTREAVFSPSANDSQQADGDRVLSNLLLEVNGLPYSSAQITSDLTLGQVKQRVEAEQSIQIAWILLDDVHQSEDTIIADLSMESTGNKLELLSRSKPTDPSSIPKERRQRFTIQLVGVSHHNSKKWLAIPGARWSDRTTYVYDRLHDMGIHVTPFQHRLSRWLENADFEFPAVGEEMSCSKQKEIKLRVIPQKFDSRIRMRYQPSAEEHSVDADDDGFVRKTITNIPRHISLRDFLLVPGLKVQQAFGVPPDMQTLLEGDWPMANEISDPVNSKRLYCIIEDENSEFTLVKETRDVYRRMTELRETWVRDVDEGKEKWRKRKLVRQVTHYAITLPGVYRGPQCCQVLFCSLHPGHLVPSTGQTRQ